MLCKQFSFATRNAAPLPFIAHAPPGLSRALTFDTAFHQTLPTYAYLYGLPYDWYKKEGIRRYGFHGTSHRFVSMKAAEILKRPLGELEIISCHLGVGASDRKSVV